MRNTEEIWRLVDAKAPEAIELSDRVWGMPELCYAEHRSCAEHTAMLEAHGFRVTKNVAGIPTAVMGEAGEEGPVIAILGEYDALPGLSQEAGIAEPRPLPGDGSGHGCGHNLLGAASLLAASAVKDWLAQNGIKGRVRYYGCPAEEGGAAKGFMVRAGCFDDVDMAICWHPAAFSAVNEPVSLANTRIDFSFTGRSSHAAAAPHLGRSALDAVELMNVGVNYMREHMPSDARIHYAYLDAGGIAPNVVQGTAKVRYLIRARDLVELNGLVARVRKIADGAALMTETSVSTKVVSAVSNLMGNAGFALRRQLPGMARCTHRASGAARLHGRHCPGNIADIGGTNTTKALVFQRDDLVTQRQIHLGLQTMATEGRDNILSLQRCLDFARIAAVFLIKLRRAKALEIVEHRLFQWRIAHKVGNRADHLG